MQTLLAGFRHKWKTSIMRQIYLGHNTPYLGQLGVAGHASGLHWRAVVLTLSNTVGGKIQLFLATFDHKNSYMIPDISLDLMRF